MPSPTGLNARRVVGVPLQALRDVAAVAVLVVASGPLLLGSVLGAYAQLRAGDELGIDPVDGL